MDPLLRPTLIKVAVPAATVVLMLAIQRKRGISWRGDLGLRAPRASAAVLWLGIWIAWMALRILAIGLLGPLADEILIALDGVMLGLSRHRTGSLQVPIEMHVVGNLFSIGRSLSA